MTTPNSLPDPIHVELEFETTNGHAHKAEAMATFDAFGVVSFDLDPTTCDESFTLFMEDRGHNKQPIRAMGRSIPSDNETQTFVFEHLELHPTGLKVRVVNGSHTELVRGVLSPARDIAWHDPRAPEPTTLRLYVHNAPTYGPRSYSTSILGHSVQIISVVADPRRSPHGALNFIIDIELPSDSLGTLNQETIRDTVFQLECLISFALGCETRVSLIEWITAGRVHSACVTNRVRQGRRRHRLIRGTYYNLIRFIEESYPNYQRERDNLQLDTLLDYYVQGCLEPYTELQFIKWSVLMEAAKFHVARTHLNRAGLVQAQVSRNNVIREFKDPNSNGRLSFKQLLRMTFEHFGYTPPRGDAAFTFISERNALFHTGQASHRQTGGPDTLRYETTRLHTQVIRLFFLVFAYTGEFDPPEDVGGGAFHHATNYDWDKWF